MTDVQADLADFQALSRKNSGNRYLLLAVDVLSRRMFGVPVKSKKPADMKRAFEELFGQMPKLPDTLYTDRGLEFVAKPLKEFYAEKGIKKFETSSKKKAAVAERAIPKGDPRRPSSLITPLFTVGLNLFVKGTVKMSPFLVIRKFFDG
uniref:Integrase catalytic domain-containing protein n=1 Tax=Globodera pallida TaxID=36090 RepID=A0A183CGF5_GLOPA